MDGSNASPALTPDAVRAALDDVKDPEIPVVSVVELGIVQDIRVDGRTVEVDITPTFTGCPALDVMRREIAERVEALGADAVTVRVVLEPPWSSDRIAPGARARMREIGLAPPPPAASRFESDASLSILGGDPGAADAPPAECPFCGATDTVVENPFGPTICRTLHYCRACEQPFESFKPL